MSGGNRRSADAAFTLSSMANGRGRAAASPGVERRHRHALHAGAGRRVRAQPTGEGVQRGRGSGRLDLDAPGGVADAARQLELGGETPDERPEADALDHALDEDRAGDGRFDGGRDAAARLNGCSHAYSVHPAVNPAPLPNGPQSASRGPRTTHAATLRRGPHGPLRIHGGMVAEGHVITVTGPRAADSLGVVDAHDHLLMDSAGMPGQGFTDPGKAIEEVLEGLATGIGTIVEMTPIGLGRDPAGLRAVTEATGVPIIAASGYHRDAHYPAGHWVHRASVEMLAERIFADLTEGMHPADWLDPSLPLDAARAGAIKGGASYHRISRGERRRLEAIAAASAATGAAILVHSEVGTAAHEIVDLLEAAGARPDRIVLAHLDRNPDSELHAEIAARGVTPRVRHDRADQVPPGQRGARPGRGGRRRRAPGPAHAGAGPRRARLLPRLRRRAGPALPDGDLRAAAASPDRRRRRRRDPRRQPGAVLRGAGGRARRA